MISLPPNLPDLDMPWIVDPDKDPAGLTIDSLRHWPDGELFSLARALSAELHRRRLPQPAALPVTAATFAALEMSATADA